MKKITIIPGDGIGPEIMDSVLTILNSIEAPFEYQVVEAGLANFNQTGYLINDESYKIIEKNKLVLKGPITTPIGEGFKSINVSLRKKYDLYANIRKIKSFKGVNSKYDDVDLVIFRENTEDLYQGEEEIIIEDNDKVAIAIKRITYNASYRIIKQAFEYAKKHKYSKVTCAHKANILKLSDGLFLDVAREISKSYPEVELEEVIIDNMCMQLVLDPNQYNVIVTMNLYGDIISDLAAGLIGGLGLVPGVNMNEEMAIFEAAHGSAPSIANQNIANPIALLLSAVELLDYVNESEKAKRIEEAIMKTLVEKEYLTPDLNGLGNTKTLTERIIFNLTNE